MTAVLAPAVFALFAPRKRCEIPILTADVLPVSWHLIRVLGTVQATVPVALRPRLFRPFLYADDSSAGLRHLIDAAPEDANVIYGLRVSSTRVNGTKHYNSQPLVLYTGTAAIVSMP
jgi:hypothetical protein